MQDRIVAPRSLERPARAPGTPPFLCLEGASYRAGNTTILDEVSLVIGGGPPTVVLGPNGAGKSTLLKLLMGLIKPTGGRVEVVDGRDGAAFRPAFVFQRPVMLRRSAAANVAYALKAAGLPATDTAIVELLSRVSLEHVHGRPARLLSSGEQQRLALARALARQPSLLLLDEPTASLDPSATKAVEEIVADVSRSGVKVVMATHDMGQARRLGGEVVLLIAGRIAEQSPSDQFFSTPTTEAARRFIAGDLII